MDIQMDDTNGSLALLKLRYHPQTSQFPAFAVSANTMQTDIDYSLSIYF